MIVEQDHLIGSAASCPNLQWPRENNLAYFSLSGTESQKTIDREEIRRAVDCLGNRKIASIRTSRGSMARKCGPIVPIYFTALFGLLVAKLDRAYWH